LVPAGTIPFTRFTGDTSNVRPLHTVVLMALITAVGFTVTSTVNVAPTQEPRVAVGVTVYTAVLAVFVLFVRVPKMEA
jgi:hypothetical protein